MGKTAASFKLHAASQKPKAKYNGKPKVSGKSRKPKAKSKYNTAASFTLPFTIDPGAPEKLTNV
jgi:hypothetical protein